MDSSHSQDPFLGGGSSSALDRPLHPPTKQLDETHLDDPEDPASDGSWPFSDRKYGFIIYRTDYADDEKWRRFMKYLNAQVHARMEDSRFRDQIPSIDWNVQSSPDLDGASFNDIRRRFNDWVESAEERKDNSSRFRACLVVDHTCLVYVNAVVEVLEEEGEPMDEFDDDGLAWVNLVSKHKNEGHLRVCVSYLMPRIFNFVEDPGWEHVGANGSDPARP